MAISEHAYITY